MSKVKDNGYWIHWIDDKGLVEFQCFQFKKDWLAARRVVRVFVKSGFGVVKRYDKKVVV